MLPTHALRNVSTGQTDLVDTSAGSANLKLGFGGVAVAGLVHLVVNLI